MSSCLVVKMIKTSPPILFRILVLTFILLSISRLCGASPAELSLQEVSSGIYVHQGVHQLPDRHNQGEIANIGFIAGDKCVAVIDTGGNPQQGAALRSAITKITKVPICYVINTHVHPDHIFGNIAFKQQGIQFVGHYKLEQAMALRAPYYSERATRDLGFTPGAEHYIPPDIKVQDTLSLDLGGRTLILTAHPTAHTDNDLSIYDSQTKTLWLGDLLFMGHLPVVDGSLNGWLKEIDRLRAVDAALVIPGHGPASAAWPLALVTEENYLRRLQIEIRARIKANRTIEEAMSEVGISARNQWQLFDEFNRKNVATGFAELEWDD